MYEFHFEQLYVNKEKYNKNHYEYSQHIVTFLYFIHCYKKEILEDIHYVQKKLVRYSVVNWPKYTIVVSTC